MKKMKIITKNYLNIKRAEIQKVIEDNYAAFIFQVTRK